MQDITPNAQQHQVQQQQPRHNQQSDQPEHQASFARGNRTLSLKQRQQQQQEDYHQSRNNAQTQLQSEPSAKRQRCDNNASRQKEHLQRQPPWHLQHQSISLTSNPRPVGSARETQSQFEVPQKGLRPDFAFDDACSTQFQHQARVPLVTPSFSASSFLVSPPPSFLPSSFLPFNSQPPPATQPVGCSSLPSFLPSFLLSPLSPLLPS